ncbi:MAG: hypothetical protein U9P79_09670 [Candidatus Cloacimonadota bacterium]|nr:hypothetical protein [Candidatus Cloacimonadota bacterium]
MKKIILIAILLLSFFSLQAKVEIEIPYLNQQPLIDGFESDGEWIYAVKIDTFYQIAPGDNTTPSSKTEAFLGYDNKNLYLMAKCYFDDRKRMRDFHCSRDHIYTTDRVFFFFDTFHSNDQAYYVGSNPNGEQADGLVLDNIDPSIDFFYESQGSKTEYGYLIEMVVPLKSLKYKSGKNVTWGGFIKRHIPDGNEEITCFPVQRGGGNFYDNYGIFTFAELPTNRNLKIIPSVIGMYQDEKDNTTGIKEKNTDTEAELNVFYEPNSNLTLTATINPDFNIIEADGLDVDVNMRYPRFYNEKRPFFIEESNPFYTDLIIFNTRNIVAPKWGTKLSGLLGKTSVYALAAMDENVYGDRFGFDENVSANVPFAFASFKNKLRHGNAFMRVASTLRSFKNKENYVFSVDGNNRFSNEINCDFQLVATTNEVTDTAGVSSINKGFGYAFDTDYYNGIWFLNLEMKGMTKDYVADLGYVTEPDFQKADTRIEYQIRSHTDEDFIRYMEFGSSQYVIYDFDFGKFKSSRWEIMNGGIFKNRFEYWTGFETYYENYGDEKYFKYFPWLVMEYSPNKLICGKLLLVSGENLWYGYDEVTGLDDGLMADYHKYETTLIFRPTNTIDLEIEQKYHEMDYLYIARTLEAKLKVQFHKNFWIRAILQYSNNDIFAFDKKSREIAFYPLFTYKPNANTSVYLGANKLMDKEKYISNEETFTDENVTNYFLKISHTFDIF